MNDEFGSETSIRDWARSPRLEKAATTKLHHLREAVKPENEMAKPDMLEAAGQLAQLFGTMIHDRVEGLHLHSFVIQHDWASAFEHAEEFSADAPIKLPYPLCAFEFRISGHHVVLLANEIRDDQYRLMGALETRVGWIFLNLYAAPHLADKLRPLLESQVRAICVALEAQVAATELIRAPYKLNRAREKRGHLQIPDYHVVTLARRNRPVRLPESAEEPSRRVRFHFRRGHWRHFEDHKTWIKWTLVGDPDLGFIDKHYRL